MFAIKFRECLKLEKLSLVLLPESAFEIRVRNFLEGKAKVGSLMDALNKEFFEGLREIPLPKVLHTISCSLRQNTLLNYSLP
jgi:hypothetical protein